MRRVSLVAALTLAAAGCEATPPGGSFQTGALVSPAPLAIASPPSAPVAQPISLTSLFGRWTGATERGIPVEIVLAEGSSVYRLRGEDLPVTGAELVGSSLILSVGTSGGTVSLTPVAGGRLAYGHRFSGEQASAVLVRA
jgi:hypothetical protein